MQEHEQSSDVFVDPVCLMNVTPGSQDIKSTYKAKTYHFCAEGCKKAFESNPDKFLCPKQSKKKGWWGRYLGRLEKATGGKSMNCH
jgi:YHS domain-containing protein